MKLNDWKITLPGGNPYLVTAHRILINSGALIVSSFDEEANEFVVDHAFAPGEWKRVDWLDSE